MWKTISIFISSTFRDMHAERDHLENVVFPELKERLRERRCLLEPIDLRIGVETASLAEEHAKELEVLKVCLAEIDRSRPFLLVLLGDRYGWIPPEERIAAAAQEAGFMLDVRGRSVTSLEIEYGLLKKLPVQRRRSLFYFREPLPYADMPPETAARYSDAYSDDPAVRAGFARLQAFKSHLEHDDELRERVHTYPAMWDASNQRVVGLSDWGNEVRDNLWRELEEETREFAAKGETTWEKQERDAIEEFVEERARDFVGREDIIAKLMALARSPASSEVQWGACVVGESGMGKSALFAHLHRKLSTTPAPQCSAAPILLLSHAAGISPQSVQVDSMLRRWTSELAENLGVRFPLPSEASAEEIENAFASLLSRASTEHRVVLLIDALNQFEQTLRARHLTWLPKLWPENARFIATTIADDPSNALGQRAAIRTESLAPLNISEAEAIALKVARRYHRKLNPQVLAAVLSKTLSDGKLAAGNPLWLELALEQLNLLDEDDFTRAEREFTGTPDQRLLKMVLRVATHLPSSISELYEWTLARTERFFGVHARAFADLVALSRFGWRESDFRVLLPATAKLLSDSRESEGQERNISLLKGQNEGLGEGFDPLRFAQLRRGFRAHIARRGALGQWDFFHAQTRLAIQRRNLGDPALVRSLHSAIAEYLESLPPEDPVRQHETMFHLIGADDRLRAARYYGGPLSSDAKTDATQVLATHILAGQDTEANPHIDWVIALPQQAGLTADETRKICNQFQFDLNDELTNEGRLGTRLRLLEATRQALEKLVLSDPSHFGWQRELSVNSEKLGSVKTDLGDLAGSRDLFEEFHRIAQKLALSDSGNAEWQRHLSLSFEKLGDVQLAQGNLSGARLAFEQNQLIARKLAASDPVDVGRQRDLFVSLEKLGDVQVAQGDLAKALSFFQESRGVAQKLTASDPSNAGWQRDLSISQEKIGWVLEAQGDSAGALEAYGQSLGIRQRLTAFNPSNSGWLSDLCTSHNHIGDILRERGDSVGALKAYREALVWRQRLAAADPDNASWRSSLALSYERVGDVEFDRGNLSEALEWFKKSHGLRDSLLEKHPSSAAFLRAMMIPLERLGDVLSKKGDLAGALKAYQDSLGVSQRLTALDPSNVKWQRGLSLSQNKVGNTLLRQGDPAGALKIYRESLELIRTLAAADVSNAQCQYDLAASYGNVGRALRQQDDLAAALKAFEESRAILQRLSARNPSNTKLQRDLSVIEEESGDAMRSQGNLAGALAAYKESLATRQQLAAIDPSNADWQSILADAHERVGAILQQQGQLNDALAAFRAKQAMILRLSEAEPSNTGYQRSLGVILNELGDILSAQGDLAGALKHHKDSLVVSQALAAHDPSNAEWQRDLWISHYKIAHVLERTDRGEASEWWGQACEILSGIKARGMFISPQDLQVLERLRKRECGSRADSDNPLCLDGDQHEPAAPPQEDPELLRRELADKERVLGADHTDTLNCLTRLANCLYSRGEIITAVPLFFRVLEAKRRALGPDHAETIEYALALAKQSQARRDYAAAEPLYRDALGASERLFGPAHPITIQTVHDIVHMYREAGNYAAAEEVIGRALELCEGALPPGDSARLKMLNDLAAVFESQGKHALAGPVLRRRLKACEEAWGLKHLLTIAAAHKVNENRKRQEKPNASQDNSGGACPDDRDDGGGAGATLRPEQSAAKPKRSIQGPWWKFWR